MTMRIGHGVLAMMRRVASTPSISGMMRSISTRSGGSFAHSSTASPPCAGDPDDLMLGLQRDHPPERFHRERQVVDDADHHDCGLANQVHDHLQQGFIVKAALGQVVGGAGLQPPPPVLLAVLVGDDRSPAPTSGRRPG